MRANYHEASPIAISIEMNLDINEIKRQNYTAMDYLSDIGGIQSFLLNLFGYILALLQYQHLETYIASKLFKIKKLDQS